MLPRHDLVSTFKFNTKRPGSRFVSPVGINPVPFCLLSNHVNHYNPETPPALSVVFCIMNTHITLFAGMLLHLRKMSKFVIFQYQMSKVPLQSFYFFTADVKAPSTSGRKGRGNKIRHPCLAAVILQLCQVVSHEYDTWLCCIMNTFVLAHCSIS